VSRRPPAPRKTARRRRRGGPLRDGLGRLRRALRSRLPSRATRRRLRRRAWRRFRRAPAALQLAGWAAVALVLAAGLNGLFQVARKPTELFFPVSGTLHKTPTGTWRAYAPLFRRHATSAITPEFLAALAQIEASGNPLARTYWRWSWTRRPFELYRPASSAVGMYQLTDGTFEQARRYCVHDHEVAEDGPWYDLDACWWNALYFRVIPSHAVELTAAYLQHRVDVTLQRHGPADAPLDAKQRLAAVIHLCGASAGARYARRGLRLVPDQRCGAHRVDAYLARLEAARRTFARLAREDAAR